MQLSPDSSADGDVVGFRVDGRPAKETIVFRSARFVRPPGLMLTVEGQPTAGQPGSAQPTSPSGTTSPVTTTGSSTGISTTLLVAGGVLLLVGGAGFAIWWRGRTVAD